MKVSNRVKKYIVRPLARMAKIIPDKCYLSICYALRTKHWMHWKNPQRFNEKMQWLKIHDYKDEYAVMADKYGVKKLVADAIGEQYVIPSIGIWKHYDDIDFEKLPEQFVLKCTHDSGGVFVCKDKKKINHDELRDFFENRLRFNYFYLGREKQYRNIEPQIMAEKFIAADSEDEALRVYKILCFGGTPRIIQAIVNDKRADEAINYYDVDWNKLELRQNYSNYDGVIERPKNLDKMLECAGRFSKDIPFLRVDFYETQGKMYFSEFTFRSDGGFARFIPDEWDYKLGEMIETKSLSD